MAKQDKDAQEQMAAIAVVASEAAERIGAKLAEAAQQLAEAVESFQQATAVASGGRYMSAFRNYP